MQRILVPMSGTDVDRHVLDAASQIIPTAHFDVRLFRADPNIVPAIYGDGYSGDVVETLITAAHARAQAVCASAQRTFDAWRQHNNIIVADPGHGKKTIASTNFADFVGAMDMHLAKAARVADMVVTSRNQDHKSELDFVISTALFQSGRPVLVVPDEDFATAKRHIVIAWDGSREAARAVGMAMPMLVASDAVTVLSIRETKTTDIDPADLCNTLITNGLSAKSVIAEKGDRAEFAALKDEIARMEASMVIMGAYGHSRLREIFFGGMTREVAKDFPIPALLVH